MAKYIVFKRSTCPECKGAGVIQHLLWTQFWREHSNQRPTDTRAKEWFRQQGYALLPPEEDLCPRCNGTGTISEEASLSEALLQLGVSCFPC